MVLNITGGFMFNTRGVYAHNVSNAYNINDDVNLVRGNHQITFGGNVSEYKVYQRCLVSGQGQYTFNGNGTGTGNAPGLGMADFLIGRLNSLIPASRSAGLPMQNCITSRHGRDWPGMSRATAVHRCALLMGSPSTLVVLRLTAARPAPRPGVSTPPRTAEILRIHGPLILAGIHFHMFDCRGSRISPTITSCRTLTHLRPKSILGT